MDEVDLLDTTKETTKVAKKKAKTKAKVKAKGTGRPASEKTQALREKALKMAKRKDGVANIDLAKALDLTTAKSQALLRPLVASGDVKLKKDKDTSRVTYHAA